VIVPDHPGYGRSDKPDWLDNISDLALPGGGDASRASCVIGIFQLPAKISADWSTNAPRIAALA
jgi:hypothetical protein